MGGILTQEEQNPRLVALPKGQRQHNYGSNQISTTKYTWYSFLPKSILFLFIRPANLVYLISAILQSIKQISSLNPITAIAPFVFVIGISLIREGYEDYKRHEKDRQINQRLTKKLNNEGEFIDIAWQGLSVGDIILVQNGQIIPADIILLHSSQNNSVAYVQTASLDGESNLKAKYSLLHEKRKYQDFIKFKCIFTVDGPNSNLHSFSGCTKLQQKIEQNILVFDNLIQRQTKLKNTKQIIGVVIYSGGDTKILKNQGQISIKISSVQKKVNKIQGFLAIVLILLSTICTIGFESYHNILHRRDKLTHLPSQVNSPKTQSKQYIIPIAILIYFSNFLLLTFLIPISLNVSIQVIKGFLGIFLSFDFKLYNSIINKGCNVNNVTILQELGMIDYILTDKTGTLTSNQMIFKNLTLSNQCYNCQYILSNTQILSKNQQFWGFWLAVLICHDVLWNQEEKQYQGSSPDQVCFINYARNIGYQFVNRTQNIIIVKIFGQIFQYELLGVIPFDNRRKMSVIVRIPSLNKIDKGKIYIYTKGADSAIFDSSIPLKQNQNIKRNVDRFAKQGYRTLVFASRQIDELHYILLEKKKANIRELKNQKSLTIDALQKRQALLVQQYQSDLVVLGATAIEDRLQDNVPQTIIRLQAAGIIVMMITGDKLETAENIGYFAGFIKAESKILRFTSSTTQTQITQRIDSLQVELTSNCRIPVTLIVQGLAISKFLLNNSPSLVFVMREVSSIIFCRSSPKEKASIVEFVKNKLQGITLAVGDGGNDVGMIQAANVGVGIMGKQGNSASTASDFSIVEFQHLDRLVLHHGRWFYYRLSYFFVFYGWKNLLMTLLLFFYMIDSAFSASSGLSQPFIAVYNVVIGLTLVVYYTIFQQDINDDLYPIAYSKLPIFYKQAKSHDLFSYKRYITWSIFSIITSIFMYYSTKYGLGSTQAIHPRGYPGNDSHHAELLSITLSFIVIMVLISDIRSFNRLLTVGVIGVLTILVTICYFLFENYFHIGIGKGYGILQSTTPRFWCVFILNVGVVYAGKMIIDQFSLDKNSQIQKTIKYIKVKDQFKKVVPSSLQLAQVTNIVLY